jgi:TRAP-type C4-dicarboxylate transport system permease small subunit
MENTEIINVIPHENQQKPALLPYSIAILVCGIVSIVVFCYFGWIMSIITLNLWSKAKKLYDENPGKYTLPSFNMAKSGKTCAIIGLIISLVSTIFWIFYILIIVYAVGHAGHFNF